MWVNRSKSRWKPFRKFDNAFICIYYRKVNLLISICFSSLFCSSLFSMQTLQTIRFRCAFPIYLQTKCIWLHCLFVSVSVLLFFAIIFIRKMNLVKICHDNSWNAIVKTVEMQSAQTVAYISNSFQRIIHQLRVLSERIAKNFYLCLKSCVRTLHTWCFILSKRKLNSVYSLNAIALANVDSMQTIHPLIWCFQSASQINSTHFYKVH